MFLWRNCLVFRRTINLVGIANSDTDEGISEMLRCKVNKSGHQECYTYNFKTDNEDCLEPNHTGFLITDKNKSTQMNDNILRQYFEQVVRSESDGDVEVPAISLFVNGGFESLETLKHSLEKGTPAIVLDGSGRAADWLSFAVRNFTDGNTADVKEKLRQEFDLKSKEATDEKIDEKSIQLIVNCLNVENIGELIKVFKIDDDDSSSLNELDNFILDHLMQQPQLSCDEKLNFAYKWNRAYPIPDKILKEASSTGDLLRTALIEDKLPFVAKVAEVTKLSSFTANDLYHVYNESLKREENQLTKAVLQKWNPDVDRFNDKKDVDNQKGRRFSVWRHRKESNNSNSTQEQDKFLGELSLALTKANILHSQSVWLNSSDQDQSFEANQGSVNSDNSVRGKDWRKKVLSSRHRLVSLFIFTLLFLRLEASEFFWRQLHYKTSAALFAVLVMDAISKADVDDLDNNFYTKVQHIRHSFTQKAIDLLYHCYEDNPRNCRSLLTEKRVMWGNLNCVTLAAKSSCREFLEQTAVQAYIQKDWMGALTRRNSPSTIFINALLLVTIWRLEFILEDSTGPPAQQGNADTHSVSATCEEREAMQVQPTQVLRFPDLYPTLPTPNSSTVHLNPTAVTPHA